jgi:hypothetical protein
VAEPRADGIDIDAGTQQVGSQASPY